MKSIYIKEIICSLFIFNIISSQSSAGTYNILDYGAVKNELSTAAIQRAVDACYEAGGGIVIVPAGTYITGTIILKSNINLYLEQGAELVSSVNIENFVVSSRRYGMIFCQDASQVSITGEDVINVLGTQFYEVDQAIQTHRIVWIFSWKKRQ